MLPDLSGLRLKRSSNPLPCVPTGRLVTYQRATDWSTVKHDVGYPRGPYFTEGCPDVEPGCADEDRVPVDPILLVEFAENERVMILGNGRVYNPASLAEWLKSWNSRKDLVTDYRITDEELEELGLEEREGVIRDIGEAEPANPQGAAESFTDYNSEDDIFGREAPIPEATMMALFVRDYDEYLRGDHRSDDRLARLVTFASTTRRLIWWAQRNSTDTPLFTQPQEIPGTLHRAWRTVVAAFFRTNPSNFPFTEDNMNDALTNEHLRDGLSGWRWSEGDWYTALHLKTYGAMIKFHDAVWKRVNKNRSRAQL